jgi:hypothetical protein
LAVRIKALVGIQTSRLDRGPVNAVSFNRGNVVVAVMRGVPTIAQKALAQNGSHREIREFVDFSGNCWSRPARSSG